MHGVLSLHAVSDATESLEESRLTKDRSGVAAVARLQQLERQGRSGEMEALARGELARNGPVPQLLQFLGVALLHQNRNGEALDQFEAACRSLRNDPALWNQRAVALKRLGRFDEAQRAFLHAYRLLPESIDILSNIGDNLSAAKRYEDALPWLLLAVERDPKSVAARVNLSNALRALGWYREAMGRLREVLEEGNRLPQALTSYARLLIDQGEVREAIALLEEAVQVEPGYVNAWLSLGKALALDGRSEDAEERYRKALTLNPQATDALVGLGNLHRDAGRFEEARSFYTRALAIDPDLVEAFVGEVFSRKLVESDVPLLERWEMRRKELAGTQQTRLCFALGKGYDDLRDFGRAFKAYRQANELKKGFSPIYDRKNQERLVRLLCDNYTREKLSPYRAAGNPSSRPVFIVGMPRSGTSLTEQILASHPMVFGAGERYFWGKQADCRREEVLRAEYRVQTIAALARECLEEFDRLASDPIRVVDKMPGNYMWLGLIHVVFPNARIIHLRRNPVDTCLSIYFQDFDVRHRYASDLDDLVHYYRQYHRMMAHWRELLPKDRFFEVSYEDLIDDPEAWGKRMLDAIGLEWNERCLSHHQTRRRVGTASNWQARQPIYKTSCERWRNYERYVEPLLELLDLEPA